MLGRLTKLTWIKLTHVALKRSPLYEKHPQYEVNGKCQDLKEVAEGTCPDLQILECMVSRLISAAVN